MNDLIDSHVADLALFVRVAEAGGLTAAARTTKIPQATISRRIAKLEHQFGVSLFERTTRRIALTEAGREVFDRARPMLDQAEAAGAVLAATRKEPSGTLRVTAPVILGQAVVQRVAVDYLERYPEVAIDLHLTTAGTALIQDGVDLAIRLGRLPDTGLHLFSLGKTRPRLVAPPGWPPITEPRDLSGAPVAMLAPRLTDEPLTLIRGGKVERIRVEKRLVTNDISAIRDAAARGLALAMLPSFLTPDPLIPILPGWSLAEIEVNAFTTAARANLPKVRRFVDALRLELQALGD
ncbi:LysR family transcriptional regulator [Aestuariibius sp. 2305UL40-4]|uniref:LysR family transcriptional regulator n=1 Tax=Aestuariibius violaceus TaxID=3234132 RepID=UPI00345E0878